MVEEYEQNANLHLLMHDFTQKKKREKGAMWETISHHWNT